MSLSLTLIFECPGRPPSTVYAQNKLSFGDVSGNVHVSLLEVSVPLPEGVEYPDDQEGLQLRHSDAYGDPLTFVSAALLVPRLQGVARGPWQPGIVAFLEKLPPSTRVVLWWH